MRTESLRPLETDCLRVPGTSTLISYLKTGENRTEENNAEGGAVRGQIEKDKGGLMEFDLMV
jgi:hypothetical protein